MTTEIKRLIRVRVDKGATFKRDGYGKKKQLSDSWRKPKGQHNKQREQKKAKGALPKPGFGSPIAVRGMHPSGFFEVLISSVKELEGINPKTHAIRIGATVGERTRVGLQEKAIAEGFKVLNARTAKTGSKQETVLKPAKVADKKQREEKKPAKSKAPVAPAKKETKKVGKKKVEKKKAAKTPEAEAKKAPVKEKKSAKPKVEPAEKTPEKTKAAAPAKTTKKTAKPKTEEPAKAKAKPKTAAKPAAKKKTGSGVKKNE